MILHIFSQVNPQPEEVTEEEVPVTGKNLVVEALAKLGEGLCMQV